MISKLARILIFLSVSEIVVSSWARPIDCRIYVFAPRCRGVASKKSLSARNYDTTALLEEERRGWERQAGRSITEQGKRNCKLCKIVPRMYPLLKYLYESNSYNYTPE